MNKADAELIIVVPEGRARGEIRDFVGQCIIHGVDFYFEEPDVLPDKVPAGLKKVRGIVVDSDDYERNRDAIAAYQQRGVRLYVLSAASSTTSPQRPTWKNGNIFHRILFDCALTVESPHLRSRMCARDENVLFHQLGERILQTRDVRWDDSTSCNWTALLDGYERTGDERFLAVVQAQVREAIHALKNDLTNCDRVSPLAPALRLYEITRDEEILNYAHEKFELYIAQTPRYKGCFVNFVEEKHSARSEIVLQVCPGLMRLWQATGEQKYADVALEQLEKLHELLHCPSMGLWHHGVNDLGPTAAFWARGLYPLLGILRVLELMAPGDNRYTEVLALFQEMAARIRELQDESGFWFQVVDNPSSEKESSGTAWCGAVFERAVRLEYLDRSYRAAADLAWEAMKSRIWRGHFPGHGTGTTASLLYANYLKKNLHSGGWTHFAYLPACERHRNQVKAKPHEAGGVKA